MRPSPPSSTTGSLTGDYELFSWEIYVGRLQLISELEVNGAFEAATRLPNPTLAIDAMKAMCRIMDGNLGDMVGGLEPKIFAARASGESAPLVLLLIASATAKFNTGAYTGAFEYLDEAVAIASSKRLTLLRSCARASSAYFHSVLGHDEDAERSERLAYEDLPAEKQLVLELRKRNNRGYAALVVNQYAEAQQWLSVFCTSEGDAATPLARAQAQANLSWLYAMTGHPQAALRAWKKSRMLVRERHLLRLHGPLILNLARIRWAQGKPEAARRIANRALRFLGERQRARYQEHTLEFLVMMDRERLGLPVTQGPTLP